MHEYDDRVLLHIFNALHGNLLNIGCCNWKLFRVGRRLLAHFRCLVCETGGLRLDAFPRDQRKFRLLSQTNTTKVYPWRCYRCGVQQEAENINLRRVSQYNRKCDVCCDFLHASPPPHSYMQNCGRRRNMLYRCNRCLHGIPPKFSLILRGICLDWTNMISYSSKSLVLFLVIATMSAETSPYRCTWTTRVGWRYNVRGQIVPLELRGIILFLGQKFTRPYSRHQHGIMTSRFIRMPPPLSEPRQMKWVLLSNNTVVHRVCCDPEWTGWHCYTCNHPH